LKTSAAPYYPAIYPLTLADSNNGYEAMAENDIQQVVSLSVVLARNRMGITCLIENQ
jgi:hypothetical protein